MARPRLFGLHVGTWVVVCLVGLTFSELQEHFDHRYVSLGGAVSYGWPMRSSVQLIQLFLYPELISTHAQPIAKNVIYCIGLLVGTAFATEFVIRRLHWPPQIRLRSLLGLLAVIAATIVVTRINHPAIRGGSVYIRFGGSYVSRGYLDDRSQWTKVSVFSWIPWHMRIVVFYAIACNVYTVGWILLRTFLSLRGASLPRVDQQ